MKLLIGVLLCTMIAADLQDDKERVILILKGVVEGIAEEAHLGFESIDDCIRDSTVVLQDLVEAVQLLKSQDPSSVSQGIKKIGEAIQVLPNAINECRSGEQEMQAIARLLTGLLGQLRSPWSFAFKIGKNLIVNGVEIYHETEAAVHDWDSQEFEDFGRQVGKILYQLLVKQEMVMVQQYVDSTEIALQVFEGVVEGIFIYIH